MTISASLFESKKGHKPPEKIPKASCCNGKKKFQQEKKHSTIKFEEKVYRGDVGGASKESRIANAASALCKDGLPAFVALPVAVRSCWPDLFPTMSSAKKSIRKGMFFVKQKNKQQAIVEKNSSDASKNSSDANESKEGDRDDGNRNGNQQHHQHNPLVKGKCDTKIFIGEVILRKLPNSSQHGENIQPRFKSRGPSTEEILSRSIGGKLRIAYLDQHLAVVVKPHGMPVHKILIGESNEEEVPEEVVGGEVEETVTGDSISKDNTPCRNNNPNQRSVKRPVSMHELLLHCLLPPSNVRLDPLRRPAAVHRLDRPTYGLLVVARTRPSARFLSKAFEERTPSLTKRYRAIVHGHLEGAIYTKDAATKGSGSFVRVPLGGKACVSEYFIVKKLTVRSTGDLKSKSINEHDSGYKSTNVGSFSTAKFIEEQGKSQTTVHLTLVDLILHTGRKHQIRRHMASLGHSIVGDNRYGSSQLDRALSNVLFLAGSKGVETMVEAMPLMLAALDITFPHPMGASNSSKERSTENSSIIKHATRAEEIDLKHCIVSTDSEHSFDASSGTLNVAISMPESMMNILRNSKSDNIHS